MLERRLLFQTGLPSMWPPRSGCAAPAPLCPFPEGPVLVGRDSWELPHFLGSLLPPLAEFGQQRGCTCSHRASLADTCQDVGLGSLLAAARPSAPCSVPAFAHVTDTWQRVELRGLGRCLSRLASDLLFLEYSWLNWRAVGLVMSMQRNVWMAGVVLLHTWEKHKLIII